MPLRLGPLCLPLQLVFALWLYPGHDHADIGSVPRPPHQEHSATCTVALVVVGAVFLALQLGCGPIALSWVRQGATAFQAASWGAIEQNSAHEGAPVPTVDGDSPASASAVALRKIADSAPGSTPGSTPGSGLTGGQSPLRSYDLALRGLRGSASDYRFISQEADTSAATNQNPARWNPCQEIGYRINPGSMHASDLREVRQAFARIEQAGGLPLRYRGLTSYVWTSTADAQALPADTALTFAFAQPGRGPGRSDLLGNARVVGVGGPVWRSTEQGKQIVAGHVVINSEVVSLLERGDDNGSRMNAYMHEIGHAVGLDHVDQPEQLMFPTLQPRIPAVLGAGDVAGLRRVGAAAGCLP